MPKIVVVEKSGELKEVLLKHYSQEEFCKKAGFKSLEHFKCQTVWKSASTGKTIALYGKATGRAGQENKYDFPPPVDKELFFGACVLIANAREDGCDDLTVEEWNKIYEELFGGFEDIGSEDTEESSDETDEYAELEKTASGYAKDGFIVDSEDEEDEEYVPPKKVKKPVKTPKKPVKKSVKKDPKQTDTNTKEPETKPKPSKKKTLFEKIDTSQPIVIDTMEEMQVSDELEPEEYV